MKFEVIIHTRRFGDVGERLSMESRHVGLTNIP